VDSVTAASLLLVVPELLSFLQAITNVTDMDNRIRDLIVVLSIFMVVLF
jgi:hypothetical protein